MKPVKPRSFLTPRAHLPVLAALVLGLLVLPAGSAMGAEQRAQRPVAPPTDRAERSYLDVREPLPTTETGGAAQAALRASLGDQGVVDVDPLTGTPRIVAKLDGFLTSPSQAQPAEIVLDYVRAHPEVFKLDSDDLGRLRLVRDYTDVGGTHHLVWAQTFDGVPAFDNDLRASVTADGRLLNVLGSPKPDLAVPTVSPDLGAAEALDTALSDVAPAAETPPVTAKGNDAARTTRFEGGDRASLVLFGDGSQTRLAWRVLATAAADEVYDTVVDAETGAVLLRANKVVHATGSAWDYYPGAPGAAGIGTQTSRDLSAPGWLTATDKLEGPFAHVYADLNDNDEASLAEEIPPTAGNWNYLFTPFAHSEAFCAPPTAPCSWNSYDPGPPPSWRTNLRQSATQVFYFVNRFHDWLEADPIGFDSNAGNFEGTDALDADVLNGVNLGGPLGPNMPDADHLNNAFMLTLPDGQRSRMSMFLYTSFEPPADRTQDVNAGDDARVVYHEYAHGLSGRLITFSNGLSALDAFQSSAMGEGWSDWYGMDFVVQEGFETDGAGDGDVVSAFQGDRTESIDCPVVSPVAECAGAGTAGSGGYTYGDLGKIFGSPEVHADGEIWAQTLWDLRARLGGATARGLVTRAMELSPTNPSFLDMRNAILQADTVSGGSNRGAIWSVFAARGMGFFASTDNAQDTTPTQNFQTPPSQTGTFRGTVTDLRTGARLGGAVVWFGGHTTTLRATTNSAGWFTMGHVPVGTYPQLVVSRKGYDPTTVAGVTVAAGTTTRTIRLRRDWASIPGGARLVRFTGSNNAEICGFGPASAFDGSLTRGWASDLPSQSITVRLPTWIDVTAFGADPGETCGDPDTASLRGYKIEVSKTGVAGSYSLLKRSSFTRAQGGRINVVDTGTRRAVRYVRFTMLSNWGHPAFLDLSEITVYGSPTPTCFGRPATKRGTNARNVILGTARADVIVGFAGNDRIYGRGGGDRICGGTGNDTLVGGPAVDRLVGNAGNDTLYARDGVRERALYGSAGTDRARKDRSDRVTGVERLF